jgi:hypothetical protein
LGLATRAVLSIAVLHAGPMVPTLLSQRYGLHFRSLHASYHPAGAIPK